jgi:putative ABC transport system permease protein
MLIHYLKITLRLMLRQRSFSLINLSGLTLGLTAFLGIAFYVADEFSFDNFHTHKNRIYRAIIAADFDGQVHKWGGAPNLLAPTAQKEIPEVEKATRYFHHNFGDLAFISTSTENFSESLLFYADPEFLDIFTVDLIRGKTTDALARPGTVLLSEQTAQKYFGDTDPIGQSISVDNSFALEVTGIYRDFPANSFLKAKLIASFTSNWFGQERNQSWGNASFDTFFLLHPTATAETVDAKIEQMLLKHTQEERWFTLSLQALTDIRLFSGDLNTDFDRREYGDLQQVKILIALGLVILVIAAVNYMNLSTAQAQRRNKEVGISKTLGATFGELQRKFYSEAALFVGVSLMLALALFTMALPVYNQLSGKQLTTHIMTTPLFWLGFGLVWVVLTVLSGSYPAWYLSSFSPKSAIQKTTGAGGQASVRKGLVVFQFAISMVLIICSVVFQQQMSFIRTKKLGYNPEQVIAVMTSAAKNTEQVNGVKTAYESMADVLSVARAQSFPGNNTSMRNITRDGSGEGVPMLTTRASEEILDVLDIPLLAGKTLPPKDPADTTIQVVINKATVDFLGLTPEEAVGRIVDIQGFQGKTEVVGVMDDFHVTSLHQPIGAFCFHNGNRTEPYTYLLVKVNSANLESTVKQLENTYRKTVSSSFEFTFLDEHLDALYQREQKLSRVVMVFTLLAVFVACLGLYALAAYTAEQRTKEIGIRKVMGASVPQLVALLSHDFLRLVIIAVMVGIPAGYYLMNQWLESFAYRVNMNMVMFLLAGLVSILIAMLTVGYKSIMASMANPVQSLRSE